MKHTLVLLAAAALLALAAPAAAQQADTLTLTTGAISVTLDKAFATGITVNALPADDPSFGPGFAEPASTQIAFSNPAPGFAPESILTLRLYRTADFAAYPEHLARLEQLQTLTADNVRVDVGAFMVPDAPPLPFIPVYTHGAVLQARVELFNSGAFEGVRYVTALAAAREPLTARSFIYTYQGLSPDGAVYLSAQAFIDASMFPVEMQAVDPQAFEAGFSDYLTESIARLNAAPSDAFAPDLAAIDRIVSSVTVAPGM